ncbi:hypothetical protein ACFLXE_00125 [Chloroflexota bacterium]
MEVGAFYYIWYGDGGAGYGTSHWSDEASRAVPMKPTLGYYESEDTDTIDAHIDMMIAAGIDFALISWWSDTPTMTRIVTSFLARAALKSFKAAVMVEGHDPGDTSDWEDDCDYVWDNWASHEAYYEFDSKPLIVLAPHWAETILPAEHADARFTLRHMTSRMGYANEWGYWDIVPRQYASGEQSSVIPGFDNRGLARSGHKVGSIVPMSTHFFLEQWRIVLGYMPDIALVCSFNEWHEGTCIEPCNEWGWEYIHACKKGSGYYGEVT